MCSPQDTVSEKSSRRIEITRLEWQWHLQKVTHMCSLCHTHGLLAVSLYLERLMIHIKNKKKSKESNKKMSNIIAYICMPPYSTSQYFHKPLYFKLCFINIVCVFIFSFPIPERCFPFSSIWFIHFRVINNPQMCFCRERMKRELITYCLGHFPPPYLITP